MGWGFDRLCWPWVRTNLVLPGKELFESFFAPRGTDVGMDWTADSDERD